MALNKLKHFLLFMLAGATIFGCASNIQKSFLPFPTNKKETFNLEQKTKNNRKNYLPDKYALMVRSDNEPRHIKNFDIAYQSLINNGINSKNIFILSPPSKTANHPIDITATNKSLSRILDYFSEVIDEKDMFVIYLNGHGFHADILRKDKFIKSSTFYFKDENLSTIQLKNKLSKINPALGILISGFCHSGYFLDSLPKNKKYIGMTSTGKRESYAGVNGSWDSYLFKALDPQRQENKLADKNNDKKVSLMEAINYAQTKHNKDRTKKQISQYFPEKGLDKIFFR